MKIEEYLLRAMALAVIVAAPVAAQPEPWFHPDGTIHYYDARAVPTGVTWQQAEDSAIAREGYLATLTSQAENDFVFGLIDSARYWYQRPSGLLAGPWLGGMRAPGAPVPESGWTWVSGEPFSYRNWTPGQPNSLNENALAFGETAGLRVPTWCDRADTESRIRGYIGELSADTTTMGLLMPPDTAAFEGYTLFAPMLSYQTYLIDNKGRLIHNWRSEYRGAGVARLLTSGDLFRTCSPPQLFFPAAGGRVEIRDWNSNLVWGFDYSDSNHCQDHDAIQLPGGNVLMIAYERKSRAEAIAAGRDSGLISEGELWPDQLVEVNPNTDSIVWEWHLWDHLVQDFDSSKANYGIVRDHSELVDINFGGGGSERAQADWIHANSVDYNEQFDQLLISARNPGELWVIDHSTTSEQARGHTGGRYGHGGDILYRWGNPQAYRSGDSADQRMFGQHSAGWIGSGLRGAGHILVFNNNPDFQGDYSTVDEFIPVNDSLGRYPTPAPGTPYGPPDACWRYGATPRGDLHAPYYSGAQRLPNGNTLICDGEAARFSEVTRDSQVVWRYVNPVFDTNRLYQGEGQIGAHVYRTVRYAPDYPGLAGHDLTPGYPVERYRSPAAGILETSLLAPHPSPLALAIQPNPSSGAVQVSFSLPRAGMTRLRVFDVTGRLVGPPVVRFCPAGSSTSTLHLSLLPHGLYICRLDAGGRSVSEPLIRMEQH